MPRAYDIWHEDISLMITATDTDKVKFLIKELAISPLYIGSRHLMHLYLDIPRFHAIISLHASLRSE